MDELLSEFALAHVESSASMAAYARDELLEKRRPVMQRWTDCTSGQRWTRYGSGSTSGRRAPPNVGVPSEKPEFTKEPVGKPLKKTPRTEGGTSGWMVVLEKKAQLSNPAVNGLGGCPEAAGPGDGAGRAWPYGRHAA